MNDTPESDVRSTPPRPTALRQSSAHVAAGTDALELLVITANREQHRFTVASPHAKTVGSFKDDLERVVWIKHDQQLLFLLNAQVVLLWDDAMSMSELRHGGGLTRDSNSASPRFIAPQAALALQRPPSVHSTTSGAAAAVGGGGVDHQSPHRQRGGSSGPSIRLLLVRDFLGVLASTSVGALPPVWHMDHYQFMLRMVSPDPGLPAEEVYPGLFLGELGAVYKRAQLKELKIRSILSAESMPPLWPDDFRYLVIKADESEDCNMLEVMEQALKFIQESLKEGGGKVLIHCMLGVSRAATLVAAYVMRELQVSLEEALAMIGRRRRVFPNQSFLQQLRWFHEHSYAVDKHTPDYRALKARYATHAHILEHLP